MDINGEKMSGDVDINMGMFMNMVINGLLGHNMLTLMDVEMLHNANHVKDQQWERNEQ